MTVFPPLALRWAGDAAWLGMDASARGFHTQLLLMAAQRQPLGTLPDQDSQWRRWLGLPELTLAQATGEAKRHLQPVSAGLALAAQAPGTPWQPQQGDLIEQLWTTRWKPMLMEAWQRVDARLVATYPHLAGAEGMLFCPTALALAQMSAGPTMADATAQVATTKGSGRVAAKRAATPRKKKAAADLADPLLAQLLTMTPDTSLLSDSDHVLKCFQVVPLPEQRQTLWELGARLLATTPEEGRTVRAFLGRLIREYGEKAVAQAVGELSVKAVLPADPKSYLLGALKQQAKGGNARQVEAMERRSMVAL